MREDDLIGLHFGLGFAVRHAFGLHGPGRKMMRPARLFKRCE
jgi:hypothetical protein